jgi:hypothetical protein
MGKNSATRSKTATRKKRNLYTSMGNYYSSSVTANNNNNTSQNINNTSTNGSRLSKRMHNNFLDNLEKTNILGNSTNL